MLIDTTLTLTKNGKTEKIENEPSAYTQTDLEKDRLLMIRQHFTMGDVMMKRPRREMNDLSVLERTAIDQMSFAVYQPNDGDALEGDQINGWRSNAVRPIVRNKIMSIAAHVTARTLFPRIHAFDEESKEQHDAAQVMSDLIEWSSFNTNSSFADVSLSAVISALTNPVSIVQTEYLDIYRTVKRDKKEDGTWNTEQMLDEDLSGFQDESVPVEQFYFQDFYQADVQKQGWVMRRRVRPFTICQELYRQFDNFKYVKPGVMIVYNDANQQFYEAYDMTMRTEECEEILYWNKALDLFLIVVNGVLLTDADNPNPREDKLYPFATFGYEYLRSNGDCFYWKSLAFKTMPDEKIVNTLYPMIIDGTYLSIMPPMVAIGGETIGSDVIVPGMVTTFSDPNSDLKPLQVQSQNLKAGFDALLKVEQNISESSESGPTQSGQDNPGNQTAYEIQQMEANAATMLGLFVQMVGRYVKQMGRLRIGDIKQHLTMAQVMAIEGSSNGELAYRTFVLPSSKASNKGKRIKFTLDVPEEEIDNSEALNNSYAILDEEGGSESTQRLAKVNPRLFRNLKYMCVVTPDVIIPMSEQLESMYNLEEYDRMVAQPTIFDPEETGRLLLDSYSKTKKHPEKYLAKAPIPGQMPQQMNSQQSNPQKMPVGQMQ